MWGGVSSQIASRYSKQEGQGRNGNDYRKYHEAQPLPSAKLGRDFLPRNPHSAEDSARLEALCQSESSREIGA